MIRVALTLALACMGAAGAAPYLPSDGGQVLQEVPRRSDPRQHHLQVLKSRAVSAPGDVRAAAVLARAYIVEGRRQSDPRYYGYAEAALKPWWGREDPPAEVLLLRATLRQATHQFDSARRDLDRLVKSDPRNPQAWLTLATVQTVTGEPNAAAASCLRLEGLTSEPILAACLAGPYVATGRAGEAYAMLARQASVADEPDIRAWLAGLQGELAVRLGRWTEAERHFRTALASDPEDAYVLGALADMYLDQKRYAEVNRLLSRHWRIDALLLRQALALKGQGGKALAQTVAELDARFAAAMRRGESVHAREEARFVLHLKAESKRALGLALRNWSVQKEAADARILLEAALAAGQPEAARPVLEWLKTHPLQDIAVAGLARQLEGDS